MRFDAASLPPVAAVAALAMLGRVALARGWRRAGALSRVTVLLATAAILTAALWVFEGRSDPLPLLFVAAYALASRAGEETPRSSGLTRALASRAAPLAVAAATLASGIWVWGGVDPRPVIQDEAAYVLQAGIFASGRWSDPTPPRPEFFEQAHVLVEPRRAAKYPPGHALALAPGAAISTPAWIPLLLAAATGGLLYTIARGVAGAPAAVLTSLIWMAAPLGLRYRSSFFSEVTTGVLWLAAWAAVDRWRRGGRDLWLVAAAAAVGWGAITRPLTMLLLAIPLGVVVLVSAIRRRAWAPVATAAAVGTLVLLLLPLWSARTTGNWRESPLALYTRQSMPFDVPGFGWQSREPERELPADLRRLTTRFVNVHRTHRPDRLPAILAERVTEFLRDGFGGALVLLLPIALAALVVRPRAGAFAVASGALLFLGYLAYAHLAHWTVYYYEVLAGLALVAGIGLAAVLGALPARGRPAGYALAVASLIVLLGSSAAGEREIKRQQEAPFRRLEAQIAARPPGRAIVFVRYASGHNPSLSLIRNGPDVASAPTWIVYDRGADNARLRAVDPSRAAYLYDEETGVLAPWDPAPSAPSAPPL